MRSAAFQRLARAIRVARLCDRSSRAQRFGLDLEDVAKDHEGVFYHFFGRHHSEAEVVDEFRAFVDAMRDDLRTVGEPTADSFTCC